MGMMNTIEALILLFVAIIVLYITMVIWRPITSDYLYPLLLNSQAFTHGSVVVAIMQLFPLVIVAALFIGFFAHIRAPERPQQYEY